MTTLIRNGTVVTSEKTFPADILIDGERIREIAASIPIDTVDRVTAMLPRLQAYKQPVAEMVAA